MEWTQVLTIIASNLALFIWARTEANSDRKQLENIINADRRDMLQILREMKEELKDFHGRLCAIEERNKNK